MRLWVVLVLLWPAGIVAEDASVGGDVPSLETAGFEEHLKTFRHSLVEFYAPWCSHCKKLAPEFEKAARQLKEWQPPVILAKVDATKEVDLATRYNVRGYPTMVWFDTSKQYEYDGGRSHDKIIEWVTSMTGDAVITSEAPEEPPEDKPRMVLYADAMLEGFAAAAQEHRRKAAWYFVKTSGTAAKVVLKHRGEEPLDLTNATGALEEEQVAAFLNDNAMPLVGLLDSDTWIKYVDSGKGLVWGLFPLDGKALDEAIAPHRPLLEEVARRIRETMQGKYFVVYTDVETFGDAIQSLLGLDKFPSLAVQQKAGDKIKWIFPNSSTLVADEVITFVEGIEEGTVEPDYKSEVAPEKNDDVVRVVVGQSLKREVFTQDLDVFLEVYAPWCGQCKKMEPEFRKIGKKVQKEELGDILRIAKIDGTKNDSPHENITWDGFPTLWFVRANTSESIKYEGERNAKAMWKFVKKTSSKAKEVKERLEQRKSAKTVGKPEIKKEERQEL